MLLNGTHIVIYAKLKKSDSANWPTRALMVPAPGNAPGPVAYQATVQTSILYGHCCFKLLKSVAAK